MIRKVPQQEKESEVPEKAILKKVRQIQIRTKRLVNDVISGEYQSAFKGSGMEFDTVREYQEGDEPRTIDWNVSARLGTPYVKSYIEERELTMMFLVDISASGLFGSSLQFKKEIAAELCAILAFNAIRNNDRVGLILFSDQVELFVPPKKGKTHVLRVIRELLYFKPQHKQTNINSVLEYLNRVSKKKVVSFLVSDFLDKDYFFDLQLTNKRHEVIAVEIQDPREKEIAKIGLIELEDAETGEILLVDSSSLTWQKQFQEASGQESQHRKDQFRKFGIDHLLIQADRSFEHDLVEFFKRRGGRR